MAIHERNIDEPDDSGQPAWPNPHDDTAFTHGCPECDAARAVLALELELRTSSLDLWVAGWSPAELLDEVRRVGGSQRALDFMAQILLVDDSHRSDQARNTEWNEAIAALRSTACVDDVATGWLVRWLTTHGSTRKTRRAIASTIDALRDLLAPESVA